MKTFIFRADRKCIGSVYHKCDYFTSFGGGLCQKSNQHEVVGYVLNRYITYRMN